MYVRIARFLRTDEVAEANGGETDESKVQCIEIIPIFQWRVKRGSATGDDAGDRGQVEHDPIYAWLPLV